MASLPCFRYPFCMVDTVGLQLETSLVQRPSWGVAPILACLQTIWLCLRIHDVIPLVVDRFVRRSRSVVDPRLLLVFRIVCGLRFRQRKGCCLRRGCFLRAR